MPTLHDHDRLAAAYLRKLPVSDLPVFAGRMQPPPAVANLLRMALDAAASRLEAGLHLPADPPPRPELPDPDVVDVSAVEVIDRRPAKALAPANETCICAAVDERLVPNGDCPQHGHEAP